MTTFFRRCVREIKAPAITATSWLMHGRLKYHSPFLCFNCRFIIFSFFMVFSLLLSSGPVAAMPYENYPALFPESKDELLLKKERATSVTTCADAIKGSTHPVSDTKPGFLKSNLMSVSIRARFSGLDILGGTATEQFQEYDAAMNFKLPWSCYSQSGWGGGIRLMTSVGVLYGGGDTALVASLIPLLTFGSQDGRFALDMGAGAALLSRHRFGEQDFGGYIQFALTTGLSIPIFKRLGVGYRFLHYSDAAVYGPNNTGADFHMLELNYTF